MPPKPSSSLVGNASAKATGIPIGDRVAAVLALAYRARRAALLEGPTGIGKSELIRQVADSLGINCTILDLSLLEPPDLVGLPVIADGRTTYALPTVLPTGGEGILLLEELNRADRTVQQPALQLLTARKLHEYELPPGWVAFAAINPEDGEYQVTPLDPALRSRFLVLKVRAGVPEWRTWAANAGIHRVICQLAATHDDLFDTTPPRSWTYASDVLHALTPEDLSNATLIHDALGGYLPPVWVKRVQDELDRDTRANDPIEAEVRLLLSRYHADPALQKKLRAKRDDGRTDYFHQLSKRLLDFVDGPELLRLIDTNAFSMDSLDALLADLPGDHRAAVQKAVIGQAAVAKFVPLKPEEIAHPHYINSARMTTVAGWLGHPHTKHRAMILANAVAAWLDRLSPTDLSILKQKKAALDGLTVFAGQVGPTGHGLTAAMKRHGLG